MGVGGVSNPTLTVKDGVYVWGICVGYMCMWGICVDRGVPGRAGDLDPPRLTDRA